MQDHRNPYLTLIIIPQWAIQPNGEAHDVSGLAGGTDHFGQEHTESLVFENTNTDGMTLTTKKVEAPLDANVAFVGDSVLSPYDYRKDLEEGFEWMYRSLIARQESLLSEQGPLAGFHDYPVRLIYRNTRRGKA